MEPLVDLERIRARLRELDAEREPLLALIRAAEAYEGVVGRALFASPSVTIRSKTTSSSPGGRAAPIMVATEKAVAETLELIGPMSTADLAELLADKPELNLPVKNRTNVLSARLSNSTKFRSRRGIGWWFKDKPWPGDSDSLGIEDSPTESEEEESGQQSSLMD